MPNRRTPAKRLTTLLARLGRWLISDPGYRGPAGELTDDDEVQRHTLPPWLWPDSPR
ncbi:hypothetical protein ABZV58_28965 [Nocardia sp. NPDC004654]|uniref:hypothetical protein n=1 Tax=Nocardia sp. NPDC004654 TaxID=3154776 RepID=UPI0033A6ABED